MFNDDIEKFQVEKLKDFEDAVHLVPTTFAMKQLGNLRNIKSLNG